MKQITILEERTGIKMDLVKVKYISIQNGCILVFGNDDWLIASFPSDKYSFITHL